MPSMIPWTNQWEDMGAITWEVRAINITIRGATIDTMIIITWMDTAWMATGRIIKNMIRIGVKKISKLSVLITSTKNQNKSVGQTNKLHCVWNLPSQRKRRFVY